LKNLADVHPLDGGFGEDPLKHPINFLRGEHGAGLLKVAKVALDLLQGADGIGGGRLHFGAPLSGGW